MRAPTRRSPALAMLRARRARRPVPKFEAVRLSYVVPCGMQRGVNARLAQLVAGGRVADLGPPLPPELLDLPEHRGAGRAGHPVASGVVLLQMQRERHRLPPLVDCCPAGAGLGLSLSAQGKAAIKWLATVDAHEGPVHLRAIVLTHGQ